MKVAGEWLASAGADRYLHLLAGLLIAFVVALVMNKIGGEGRWTCVFFAMMVTVIIGIIKEVIDQTFESVSDAVDFAFTCVGGVIGAGLWLL